MKKMIKKYFLFAAAAAASLALEAATIKPGSSGTITLNDDGEALLDVSGLSLGGTYTFISDTGEADSVADLDLIVTYYDPDLEEDEEAYLGTFTEDTRSTSTGRLIIEAEDWADAGFVKGEDYDPEFDVIYTVKSGYLYVSGDPGAKVTISCSTGIINETVPAGCSEKPVQFGVINAGKDVTKTGTFCDEDDYWFYLDLKAGCKYSFKVTGSGVYGSLTMFYNSQIEAADDFPLPEVNISYTTNDVTGDVTVTYESIIYSGVPRYSGRHYLQIDGEYGTTFTVVGSVLPTRTVDKHPIAGVLEDGEVREAVAGARNDSGGAFYDEVIDTSLYAVELKAGRLALFETAFDNAELNEYSCVMELYDEKGTCLARNYFKDAVSDGQRLSYLPEKSGTYYVGVCQDGLEATTNDVNVTGSILYTDLGEVDAEADDKPATGNTLSIVLGNDETEGAQQFKADGSPLELNATNRVDWFILGARNGVTYSFIAKTDDDHYVEARPLKLVVYTLDAKGSVSFVQDLGDAQDGVVFIAEKNATYYIKASLENGEGCDCPYELYAWVNGDDYGFLKVEVKGSTTSLWNIKGESSKYGNGSEILLKPGKYTVQAAKASGWTKPADKEVTVEAGNDNRTTCILKYSDTSDPGDDKISGAVSLSPTKAKPVTESRSLWAPSGTDKGDAADCFKLKVTDGTVYGLKLEAAEGSPVVTVYRNGKDADGAFTGQILAQGTDISFMAMEKGTYHAVVTRADDAADVDAAYTLTATACNVGYVKTDKTEYKVGEKAGYLTVKFSRTTKEGRVRVRYTTEEGTALANVHYVAQTGVLEWADGDSKAQEVKIKIIPDLVDAWAEDRTFSIKIDAVDDEDFDETAEYRPLLAADEVAVTISDSSKVAPGTLQFAAGGEDAEPFANPSKPTMTVAAGDDAVLWISRTGGADKMVAVVATVTAKQNEGEEYVVVDEQEIWWDDGDAEDKQLRITTMRPSDAWFAAKTFTVKIAALAADAKATVKNGSATVTVVDGDSPMDFAAYAASFPKKSGVSIKAGKADTWYFDAIGALRSVMPAKKGDKAELTFSVTGPGRLRFSPDFVQDGDDTTCTVMVGKNALETPLDGTEADLFLGTGKVDVKITVTRGANATAETDSYLALYPQDGDVPFLWEPLPMPTLVSPANDKELVNPEHAILRWAGAETGNVYYRISIDVDKKKVGTDAAEISQSPIGTPSYEICEACGGDPLQPNTTYSWRVDSMMLDDDFNVRLVNTNKSVWTFKTAAKDAPVSAIVSATDLTGADVADLVASGEPITAVQGVLVTNLVFGSEKSGVTWSLASGKLPAGLAVDKNTGAITGAPQKTGDFAVAVQATSGRDVGPAVAFTLRVLPIELAAGTFNGLVDTDDDTLAETVGLSKAAIGSLNVTVKDTGAISASVVVGDNKFAFKANSYDGFVEFENGQPGVTATMMATVKLLNATYTNTLTIAACRAGTNDWTALDTPLAATLTLNFLSPDKKSVISNVEYAGIALRDNTKFKEVVAAQAPYRGYYTITLPVSGGDEGAPQGNGYLTMTLDAKGKAKIAGVLADGTALSASAVTGYISDDGEGKSAVYLPVYMTKKSVSVGGWVRLSLSDAATVDGQDISAGAPLPVADADSGLKWINADAHAAYDGEKWSTYAVELTPVGGYYSTVVNLQAYYKNYSLYLVDLLDSDQLPTALKGDGYEWAAYPGMVTDADCGEVHGLYVDMAVNTPTVEKSVIVNTTDANGKKTKLIDWSASVNPCKFAMSFKPATGIFSGSFDLYTATQDDFGNETAQNKVGSFKHQGVLLLTRDEAAPLAVEDGVMSGFYTAPVKAVDSSDNKSYTWNASYMLLIGADEIVNPPTEGWDSEEP